MYRAIPLNALAASSDVSPYGNIAGAMRLAMASKNLKFHEVISDTIKGIPARNSQAYVLPEEFLNGFANRKPKFGFGGVGDLTFVRSYSRPLPSGKKETWHQVMKRVTEGTINMAIRHLISKGLPVKRDELDTQAKEMLTRMFEMKFLPPGRGLWCMGTAVT